MHRRFLRQGFFVLLAINVVGLIAYLAIPEQRGIVHAAAANLAASPSVTLPVTVTPSATSTQRAAAATSIPSATATARPRRWCWC